jgi:hypothetical protein
MIADSSTIKQCNAARPTCTSCTSIGQECVYRTGPMDESRLGVMKKKYSDLELRVTKLNEAQEALQQLFEVMRSRSEGEAEAIFRIIRSGADVDYVLRYMLPRR